jgi:hypothetical protein
VDALSGTEHDLLRHLLGFAVVAQQSQQHEQAIGAPDSRSRQPRPRPGPGHQARLYFRGIGARELRHASACRRRHRAFWKRRTVATSLPDPVGDADRSADARQPVEIPNRAHQGAHRADAAPAIRAVPSVTV